MQFARVTGNVVCTRKDEKLVGVKLLMVINVGALKSGNETLVFDDISAVREATRGKVLKVIIETAYLTRDEKIRACKLSKQANADFVKTSTGFGPGGATAEDVKLMRETVGADMKKLYFLIAALAVFSAGCAGSKPGPWQGEPVTAQASASYDDDNPDIGRGKALMAAQQKAVEQAVSLFMPEQHRPAAYVPATAQKKMPEELL